MIEISERSSLEEMKKCLDQINQEMGKLEETEPANESSAAHKAWEEKCDDLALMSETVMTLIDRKMSEGL